MNNKLTITLITFSIALLLVLQVFWLHNTYEKAYFDLRREGSHIFRNTVFQLRDSLYTNTLTSALSGHDSSFQFMTNGNKGSLRMLRAEAPRADSIILRRQTSSVQVFISSDGPNDSLAKSIAPITNRLKMMDGSRSFTIRIAPDSLNVDSLSYYFKKNLSEGAVPARVHVYEINFLSDPIAMPAFAQEFWRSADGDSHSIPQLLRMDSIRLEPVRLNPHRRYAASLSDIQPIIFKEILPQILFSLFLTITTIAAFVFLYRTLRSQQKLMAIKNDFISNITHELKTPVATVSVALEALQNFDVASNPERSREYISIAQQELKRLTTMTDSVLKTTVLEERGMTLQREAINLEVVIENALAGLKLLIDKSKAAVTIIKSDDDYTVAGSTVHLTSVLSNLIENALKYSNASPDIKISLLKEHNVVKISVRDNGIGIPDEYRTRIFEKFFRVPTGNVHNIKGYGLGLSYVASIVKAHHGKIEVNSKEGEGSEFIISIPL